MGADLDIGGHAVVDDDAQLVRGSLAEPTGERQSPALQHDAQFGDGGMVSEWDGTPLRVDIIRNFPDFVTDDDLRRLLAPIGRLEDQIEARLGYRIVEMGDLIEVPDGAQPGWDQDFDFYWRNDGNNDLLPRELGQILVFYLNDDNDGWGGGGAACLPMSVAGPPRTTDAPSARCGPVMIPAAKATSTSTRAREKPSSTKCFTCSGSSITSTSTS